MSTKGIHFTHKVKVECNCIVCGKTFIASRKDAKICSTQCSNQYYKEDCAGHGKLTKICPICGKEFTTYRSNKQTCSENCGKKYKSRNRNCDLHEKWLKNHPNAKSKQQIHEEAIRKSKERDLIREQNRKMREEEKAERDAERIANFNYWCNFNEEKTCEFCGKTFIAKYPTSKYCSDECKRKRANRQNGHKFKKRYNGITIDNDITLEKLAKRDGQRCKLCGLLVNWDDKHTNESGTVVCGDMYPSIDHIVPISLGGLHSWENVQLAHRICNYGKSNKYIG